MNNILYNVQYTSHCQCVESPDTLPRLLNTNTHPQMLSRQWWKAAFFIETQNKPTLTNEDIGRAPLYWKHDFTKQVYMVLCVIARCYVWCCGFTWCRVLLDDIVWFLQAWVHPAMLGQHTQALPESAFTREATSDLFYLLGGNMTQPTKGQIQRLKNPNLYSSYFLSSCNYARCIEA